MTRLLILLSLSLCAVPAWAQTAVVIGPNSKLAWDELSPTAGIPAATFQGFTYALTVDTSAPVALAGVVCTAMATIPPPSLSGSSCTAPVSQIPIGSHVLTLTASASGLTSVPSAPYAYLSIAIPVPLNPRLQ